MKPMSLEAVLTEVRRGGDEQAQAILRKAKDEAAQILAEAKAKAQAHEAARLAEAERDAEQVLVQAQSRAESDARKLVLAAEAKLRDALRAQVLEALAALPTKSREAHLKTLLDRAQAAVPEGRVWGAEADHAALKKQKAFAFEGTRPMAGGIIVESTDGSIRVDLSYETLLDQEWRNILKAESAIFA